MIDLGRVSEGLVLVRNKPERADELDAVVRELADLKSFPPSKAAKVYGRLNFAEAQCSGDGWHPQRALMGKSVKFVTPEISSSLDLAAHLLRNAPPRRLRALTDERPFSAMGRTREELRRVEQWLYPLGVAFGFIAPCNNSGWLALLRSRASHYTSGDDASSHLQEAVFTSAS